MIDFKYLTGPIVSRNDYVVVDDTIRLNLLGAKKENISIETDDRKIYISAITKDLYGKEWKYEKTFLMSDIYNITMADATYEDGILEIKLNTVSKDKRKIEIK